MKLVSIAVLFLAAGVAHGVPLQAGDKAPCIALPQVDQHGNKATESTCLSNPGGKKIVVEFFATWCGYCVQNLPVFESLATKYKDVADFRILGLDTTTKPLEKFFEKRLMDGYAVAFDPKNLSSDAFQIDGTPSLYVIGTDGTIALFHEGTMETKEEIKRVEDAILH